MRIIPAVLLLIVAGISTATAQDAAAPSPQDAPALSAQPAPSSPAPVSPPSAPSFDMDHGNAAAAAAASKASAAAAKAKADAIRAGRPLSPSQSTDFNIHGGGGSGVARPAPPLAPEQQKADAEARDAWQARCRPAVVTDAEGLRRTQYAAPDCDLSRPNTAGGA
jgi:hypothetical protein